MGTTGHNPETLAADLRRTMSLLRRRLLEQSEPNDLTHTQTIVLQRLENGEPTPVSTLARAAGIRPQSMSAAVKGLMDAGFVKGTRDPKDGRQVLMSLTSKCKLWLQSGRTARQDWLATAIKKELPSSEREQLAVAVGLLERLARR